MTQSIRIGILNDMAAAPPGPSDITTWLQLAIDEVRVSGRLDRDVEFVQSYGLGLPSGSAAAVERAFHELVEQDVLAVIGPAIGDNALVATPLAEQQAMPTINWAGTERARGQYMFHLQVGSHEDESIVLARFLSGKGLQRLAVVYDQSPIGRRYFQFFQQEADILGLDIAVAQRISPLAEGAESQATKALASNCDALVYLGLGVAVKPLAEALSAINFARPCVLNTAGIRGYDPQFAQAIDQWLYLDMFSDSNQTLADFCQRHHLPKQKKLAAAKGYDLGRLLAEGLVRASELTRDGIKHGLEQIKWLPAAEGKEGTLLGFGHYDRGALHGQYLVMRQWQNAETVEVL